eukprot:SM000016S01902  [mRNA]  locus=s16:418468:422079:- [translate_table: standard]
MEASSQPVALPLLADPAGYRPCTVPFRGPGDAPGELTPAERTWVDVFRRSIPSFQKRAAADDSVTDAESRAARFAERYAAILDELESNPESNGGPPDIVVLCRLRELVLREVGFEDIFRKVKVTENAKALALLPDILKLVDAVEDPSQRLEHLIRGVFAGNIFDLGAPASTELFDKDGMSFLTTLDKMLERPWVIDHLDRLREVWVTKTWKKAIIFVDNAGADVILGILPLARELLRRGTQVALAANEVPALNDITYSELLDVLSKVDESKVDIDVSEALDAGRLLVVSSGNDLPVIDLSLISPELAFVADDADLIVLEGMGRSIETNLYASFKCDSLNLGMIKHQEVATFLEGRLYDCVISFKEAAQTKPRPVAKLQPVAEPVFA